MKSLKILVASLIIIFSSVAVADSDWYVSGYIAAVDVDDINTRSTTKPAGVTRLINVSSDSEIGLGIAVGKSIYKHNKGTFFLELGYQQSEHDVVRNAFNGTQFSAAAGASKGDIDVKTLSLSAIYQFNLSNPSIKPYVGLGIGSTTVDLDLVYGGSVGAPAKTPPYIDDEDSAVSILYRFGIEYGFNNNWSATAEYQFLDIGDVSWKRTGGGPGGLATTTQKGDLSTDSIKFGVKYSF